jgi:hypothetical protein
MEFAERVPAVLCADCGRIFATDAALSRPERYGASPIARVEGAAVEAPPMPRRAPSRVAASLLGSGGF